MIQNPFMTPQIQALSDFQSTNPTAPTTSARVMPGMPQPVQPVGDSFQPNNRMGGPVNALADYYSKNPSGSPAPGGQFSAQFGATPSPNAVGQTQQVQQALQGAAGQSPSWGSTPAPITAGNPLMGQAPQWGASPAPNPTGAPVTGQAPPWGQSPAPAPGQPQQGALPPGTGTGWGTTPAPVGAPFTDATNSAPPAMSPQLQALYNRQQGR